jgi:hypothetical protein
MKVGLIHKGGRLPNVALMRLSSWHKAHGDEVLLNPTPLDGCGKVYISTLFTWQARQVETTRAAFAAHADIEIGGSGFSLTKRLPDEVDAMPYDFDLYGIDYGMGYSSRGCIRHCSFCLTPESQVLTADGPKAISGIEAGEAVLTHKGRYRAVRAVVTHAYEVPVFRLRTDAVSDLFPVRATAEHPVLVRHLSQRGSQGGNVLTAFKWAATSDLRDFRTGRSSDLVAYPRTVEVGEAAISESMAGLVGWYLAEGYISTTLQRGAHRVTFCLGFSSREMGYAEEIQALAAAEGLHAKVYRLKIGIRVTIDNVRLARWLADEFDTGSREKRLPMWVRQLPKPHLEALVQAWINGDGHTLIKRGTPTWVVTTVSPHLALGLREVALKLGMLSTINQYTPKATIQGRQVNAVPGYTVIMHYPVERKQTRRQDARFVYSSARATEAEWYSGLVYDLTVDEDESYCTASHALHNCPVPRSEGHMREDRSISELLNPRSNKLMLLDNNFFASDWRPKLAEIEARGLLVDWPQGNDIRLMTPEIASALGRLRERNQISGDVFTRPRTLHFAWDLPSNDARTDEVTRGVHLLFDAGFTVNQLRFYVLIGFPGYEVADELHRIGTLHELGIEPYVMVYRDYGETDRRSPLHMDIQHWNNGHAWRKIPDFRQYRRALADTKGKPRQPRVGPMFEPI